MFYEFLKFCFWLFAILCVTVRVTTYIRKIGRKKLVIGFFHPYCNDGGGGERVLWKMIDALQQMEDDKATAHKKSLPPISILVYSGDVPEVSPAAILARVAERFEIQLRRPVEFVPLNSRPLVEASRYPRLTMIFQSLASMLMGFEALFRYPPDIFFDTMGYSFTFPVLRWAGGATVAAYVHYPTISTDMLARVGKKEAGVTNENVIARSPLLTNLKLYYYRLFASVYGFMGARADLVLVNSSWTRNHIQHIWRPRKLRLLYPPVDTRRFQKHALENRKPYILSIGQFRPEKNHALQLEAFLQLTRDHSSEIPADVKLVMVGSIRGGHSDDAARLERLKARAKELGLEERVLFVVGASNKELQQWVGESLIGLHTMKDEHFGIGVVEMMASGLVTVAHNSAGPKEDIVKSTEKTVVGYLATTEKEYVDRLLQIFRLAAQERVTVQQNGRDHAATFSDAEFERKIKEIYADFIPKCI